MATANDQQVGVGKVEVTLPSDREVRIVRSFDAPKQLVFDAWTSPAHQSKWLHGPPGWAMTACEGDLQVGGKTRLAWTGPAGESLEIRSTYQEVSPPDRVVALESWGGWEGSEWPETVNKLEFEEKSGRTTVILTILYASKEARDKALQTGMSEGMDFSMGRLEEYLRTIG